MAVKQWKLDKWLKRAILESDIDDARKSLIAGADPNHVMVEGEVRSTPLIQAATKHADLVGLLLEYGADVRGTDRLEATALHFAKDPETIAKLLAAGADPNAKASEGDTPLHVCTMLEKAQLLIDAGADPTALNERGMLPWQNLEEILEAIEIPGMSDSLAVRSCRNAIDALRALAENESLDEATSPVQMTQEQEARKTREGRF